VVRTSCDTALPSAPIGFQPSAHVARVQTWLDDFERDPAFDGLLLLSSKHEAKASFTDLLHQLVIADYTADIFADVLIGQG
jgi:hypothetical protein